MNGDIFVNQKYQVIAGRFAWKSRVIASLLLPVVIGLSFLLYFMVIDFLELNKTEKILKEKSQKYISSNSANSEELKYAEFIENVRWLDNVLPDVAMPPVGFLSLIEGKLPKTVCLISMEYNREKGEFRLHLKSKSKSDDKFISQFVDNLDGMDVFSEVVVQDEYMQDGNLAKVVTLRV